MSASVATYSQHLSTPGLRVLVTGAGGFVGRHIIRKLNEYNLRPVALHSPASAPPTENNADWVSVDFTDSKATERLVKELRPHYVFHFAASLSRSETWQYAEESTDVHFCALNKLMIALGRHAPDLRRLLLLGSAEEYGNAVAPPFREEYPIQPRSLYAAAKSAATTFALLYSELFLLPVTVLRPFILYGPGQTGDMLLPQLILSALRGEDFRMTGGKQTRDFVYIDDAVSCIMLAAVTEEAEGEVLNICSGIERRVYDVAALVMDMMQADIQLLAGALPYKENEIWRCVGSNEKTQRLLGWSAQTDFRQGLRNTIEWFRNNGRVCS